MAIAASHWAEAGPSNSRKRERNTPTLPSSFDRRSSDFLTWKSSRKYAVIVDAGSSGSRMQIYSWKDARVDKAHRERAGENLKVLPTVEKGTWEGSGRDWQLKVEPGLSTFGSHPHDLANYLKPLFDHASSIIPPEALSETPIYVLATAGMRFLPPEQREAVIEETCRFIDHDTPFSLGKGGCADHIQIITGEEEGLLGWIAINYLMDGFHFKPDSTIQGSVEGTKGRSTYGFLDMGGASTQIAFEPSGRVQVLPEDSKDLTPVKLRMLDGTDVTHNVFVTTFLGFGTNKARERYLQSVESTGLSQPLIDPCLPDGLRMQSDNGTQLLGTGSFDTCLSSLAPLLDKDAKCNHPPCLFHGVHVPAIDFSVNHFIGVSEYWFSSNDVFKLGGVYDFVSFQKAAQDFCGRPWSEIEMELKSGQVFGKQVTKDRLEMQCFKSAWMTTVLHEGIGLPRITDSGGKGDGKPHADEAQDKADEKNLFQSVNDVKGLAVSWTLGKAVLEATKEVRPAPPSPPVYSLPPPVSEHADSTWQDKFASSHPVLNENKKTIGGGIILTLVILIICLTAFCCFFRGRSAKASKRRSAVKDFVARSCIKKRPRGDYVLANMEEGSHDIDMTIVEGGGGSGGDVALSSDSGDEVDRPKGQRHKHRRSSGNGLFAALFVPVQRLALAMGIQSSTTTSSNHFSSFSTKNTAGSGRLAAKRKTYMPRLGLRRNLTSPAMSGPASPSNLPLMASNSIASLGTAISRPASRASNHNISPRLNATLTPTGNAGSTTWTSGNANPNDASAGFFSHLQQGTTSSTASARSSRAASPAFGSTVNGRSSRNTNSSNLGRRAWEEE
ncbi:hypothetical protein CBS101457_003186 [Exobasidium rhododendri]|nr:hypothetical protein CBS101457_003186 [Exobasidium rhododendri]